MKTNDLRLAVSRSAEALSPSTILALAATTRRGSTSEKAVAVAEAKRLRAEVVEFTGPDLMFSIFDPESKEVHEVTAKLREALRGCDGVLISSAAYNCGIPGVLKNVIDYIDTADPKRPYLADRAIGTIACAGGWQGCGTTVAAWRSVVHALRGWPTPLGVVVNSSEPTFDDDGSRLSKDLSSNLQTSACHGIKFAAAPSAIRVGCDHLRLAAWKVTRRRTE